MRERFLALLDHLLEERREFPRRWPGPCRRPCASMSLSFSAAWIRRTVAEARLSPAFMASFISVVKRSRMAWCLLGLQAALSVDRSATQRPLSQPGPESLRMIARRAAAGLVGHGLFGAGLRRDQRRCCQTTTPDGATAAGWTEPRATAVLVLAGRHGARRLRHRRHRRGDRRSLLQHRDDRATRRS